MEAIKPVWDYSDLLEEAKDRIEEKLYLEGEIKKIFKNFLIRIILGCGVFLFSKPCRAEKYHSAGSDPGCDGETDEGGA